MYLERKIIMKKILPVIMILMLILSSCKGAEYNSDKIQVYASFYAMNDFVRTVGGDDIVYHSIVPLDTEPHDFEPTAADMAKLSESDVFVYNGAGMESWAEKVADTLPDTVSVVCASSNLPEYLDGDPHVWLSFKNVKVQLQSICDAFSEVDASNAVKYQERTNAYISELDELENEYKNAGLSGRKIFVTHGAYEYLCNEFGMEQAALEGISGESDPSPAQMASVVDQIRADGAKCIFYDPLEGDKIAKAAAQEAGIEALPLYTFEGDGEHRDYITVMRENLEHLKKAF